MDTKLCRTCGETKDLALFYKNAESKDGRAWKCKVCTKAYDDTRREERNRKAREVYYADPAAKIAKTIAYHRANPEWARERMRVHHVANAEARAERAKQRGLIPEVKAARRGASRRSESRRRALVAGVTADLITASDIAGILCDYENRCYICEREFSDDLRYEIDHRRPLARGGAHVRGNLAPACGPCNVRKNARWPFTEEMREEIRRAVLGAAVSR